MMSPDIQALGIRVGQFFDGEAMEPDGNRCSTSKPMRGERS